MSKIEKSNDGGRFSETEIRSQVAASKSFWASPAGKRRSAELEREKRNHKPTDTAARNVLAKLGIA